MNICTKSEQLKIIHSITGSDAQQFWGVTQIWGGGGSVCQSHKNSRITPSIDLIKIYWNFIKLMKNTSLPSSLYLSLLLNWTSMDGGMLCFSYFHFLSEAAVKNMGWKIDILTLPPHSPPPSLQIRTTTQKLFLNVF